MKSNTMPPKNPSRTDVRITASCVPVSLREKAAPDVHLPLPPGEPFGQRYAVCLQKRSCPEPSSPRAETPREAGSQVTNAVCLQPTLNGGLCLAEVVSFHAGIITFREFRQVSSFAEAVAVSAELKRPMLERLQIRAILEKSRHEKEPVKTGHGTALAEAPMTSPKEAPMIADTLPAEPKEWCLFALKNDCELEAQGLTLTDALNLQLAEIHTGASWTAVYRTHKTFVVYNDIDDPNGEEHWAGANLTNANKEGN